MHNLIQTKMLSLLFFALISCNAELKSDQRTNIQVADTLIQDFCTIYSISSSTYSLGPLDGKATVLEPHSCNEYDNNDRSILIPDSVLFSIQLDNIELQLLNSPAPPRKLSAIKDSHFVSITIEFLFSESRWPQSPMNYHIEKPFVVAKKVYFGDELLNGGDVYKPMTIEKKLGLRKYLALDELGLNPEGQCLNQLIFQYEIIDKNGVVNCYGKYIHFL
jgi:hypothetical protein